MFEAAFFLSLLLLYYSVLVERKQNGFGFFETLMDVWIAAFAYDELSGLVDAGVLFYQMDFWSLWNLGIIGVGVFFIITSESTAFSLLCQSLASRLDLLQFLGLTHTCRGHWVGEGRQLHYRHFIRYPVPRGSVFGSEVDLPAFWVVYSSAFLTQGQQNLLTRELELLFW